MTVMMGVEVSIRFRNEVAAMATEAPERFGDIFSLLWPFAEHRDFISLSAGYNPFCSVASRTVDSDLVDIAKRQGLEGADVLAFVARRIADRRTGYGFSLDCISYDSIKYFFENLIIERTALEIIDLLDSGRGERLRRRLQCEPGETIVEAYRRSKGGSVSGLEAVADLLEVLAEMERADVDEWMAEHPDEIEEICEDEEGLVEAVEAG